MVWFIGDLELYRFFAEVIESIDAFHGRPRYSLYHLVAPETAWKWINPGNIVPSVVFVHIGSEAEIENAFWLLDQMHEHGDVTHSNYYVVAHRGFLIPILKSDTSDDVIKGNILFISGDKKTAWKEIEEFFRSRVLGQEPARR